MSQQNMSAQRIQSVLTVLCAIFLAASFAPGLSVLAYLSVACGAYFAIGSAWESLRERSIDVNLLMVLAAAGAVIIGQVQDAGALLFLFSLSSTLESLAMSRTKSAIEGLVKLRPSEATLVTSEGESQVPVEALKLDDRIRVAAFAGFPVDGEILEGSTSVNQSAMTGESREIPKRAGDMVLSGTQNLEGTIVLRVASTVGDSTLDRIVALVHDAQENKASGERVSQWFGQTYTLFVLGAFAVSLLIRLALHFSWVAALSASLTLLVALSPCALVISTPAATLSALAWAARRGILIRGGEFIERLGQINFVALDKTGTLTSGQPSLNEICVCTPVLQVAGGAALCKDGEQCWSGQGQLSAEASKILRLAAAAEQYSSHPLAEAIVRSAREQGISIPGANDQKIVPGKGVTALVEGHAVRVGQVGFFEGDVPDDFMKHVAEIQRAGMTSVVCQIDGDYAALGLSDTIRPESAGVIDLLRKMGVREVVMLTGDSINTAEAVAKMVGVDWFQAALLPDDKEKLVAEAVKNHQEVMMVGDGVNDAPSLARAGVGVAMGGLGSDVALNAADVVLMNDRLDRIPMMIGLGKRTNLIIRSNLVFAASVIVALTTFSLFGKLPLPIAVLGHEGSTVLVILNGLRLLNHSS